MRQDHLYNKDVRLQHSNVTADTKKFSSFLLAAHQALRLAARVLDNLGLDFWLAAGTLLGWARECSIFPHALDVDLGMRAHDFSPEIIIGMQQVGLQVSHRFGLRQNGLELSFQHNTTNVKLDLFVSMKLQTVLRGIIHYTTLTPQAHIHTHC